MTEEKRDLQNDLALCNAATSNEIANVIFNVEAREGWPHAIQRALEAEAEVERLQSIIKAAKMRLWRCDGMCVCASAAYEKLIEASGG